jgi:dTDP-4-dehydrorhamnose reductase
MQKKFKQILIKKRILIFGKKSFIGSNLFSFLKEKYKVSLQKFNKKNLKIINNYDFIINCSTNKNYVKKKYSKKNDFDLDIVNNIKNNKTIYIFLSTRKIYKPKSNITENSKIECNNNYAQNKLITEHKILKIRPKNLVILRISNLIGLNLKISRKIHFTYLDFLLEHIKKKELINNKKKFRDFLDIDTFVKVVNAIIKKKIVGIYNVSIGQKIYLNEINDWILHHFKYKKNLKYIEPPKNYDQRSFFLNNSKLKNKLKINIHKKKLKKECLSLSQKLFFG